MEAEELLAQKKLRAEAIQLEDMLAQVRKEYEMLRIEFEQNLAANEQTGPINKEMRNLITSLQTHNVQLKARPFFHYYFPATFSRIIKLVLANPIQNAIGFPKFYPCFLKADVLLAKLSQKRADIWTFFTVLFFNWRKSEFIYLDLIY